MSGDGYNLETEEEQNKLLKGLGFGKVLIPVLIGIAITVYLFSTEYKLSDLTLITHAHFGGIVSSVLLLILRDAAYVFRIRHLSERNLDWTGAIYVILLWEFSSAVTPSAVGGTVFAVFFLFREGLSVGKSVAYVVVTAVFDNLFFISAGIILFLIYQQQLFATLSPVLTGIFFISFALILLYTFFMAYGVFFRPRAIKWLLVKITGFRLTRRFRQMAHRQGDDLIIASTELMGKPFKYWAVGAAATIVIWVARYLIINGIIESFADVSFKNHLFIFAENVVLWIIMLFSVTPGAAGQAEVAFNTVFQNFVGEYGGITLIFWRSLTYYLYLLLGVIILPRWIARVVNRRRLV